MPVKKPTKARTPNKVDPTLTRKLASGGFVTYADRVAVSKILESNKYNIRETARQLGIDEQLVKAWHDQVKNDDYAGVDDEKNAYAIEVRKKTTEEMAVKTSAFLKTAFDVKDAALTKMKELVPDSDSIRDLATVIKTLHEIETGSRMSDDEEKAMNKQPMSVMMQVAIRQLKIVNNNHEHGESSTVKRIPKGDNKG